MLSFEEHQFYWQWRTPWPGARSTCKSTGLTIEPEVSVKFQYFLIVQLASIPGSSAKPGTPCKIIFAVPSKTFPFGRTENIKMSSKSLDGGPLSLQ
jgi:hypothetical protein